MVEGLFIVFHCLSPWVKKPWIHDNKFIPLSGQYLILMEMKKREALGFRPPHIGNSSKSVEVICRFQIDKSDDQYIYSVDVDLKSTNLTTNIFCRFEIDKKNFDEFPYEGSKSA